MSADAATTEIGNYVPDLDRVWVQADADTNELLTVFSAVAGVANQCILNFADSKLTVEATNPSKTAAVRGTVPLDWDTGPETFRLAAGTDDLLSAATFHGHSDGTTSLEVHRNRDDGEVLTITSSNYIDWAQTLNPDDVREYPETDLDRPTTATIDSAKLLKAAVGSVDRGASTQYTIGVESGQFAVEGGHYWSEMQAADPIDVEQDGPAATSTFSNVTLGAVVSTIDPAAAVELTLRDDFPVQIETDLLQIELAPTIPNDPNASGGGDDDE